MNAIWLNAWTMPVSALNQSYGALKTVFKGDKPYIVSRIANIPEINAGAINVFPDMTINMTEVMAVNPPNLQDLMEQSAEEILASFKAAHVLSKLYVWWSGGLDSTAILLTLLCYDEFKELLHAGRAFVVCNEASAEEYPKMWNDVVKDLPRVESDLALYMQPLTCHVDGVWADELFGNYQAEHWSGNTAANSGQLRSLIKRQTARWDTIKHFLEFVEPLETLFPAETLFQRLWWLEYTLGYQDANLRSFYNGSNQSDATHTKLRFAQGLPFRWFSHQRWNSWAIHRQLENKFVTYRDSKMELRQFIFGLNGDLDYMENKDKQYSQGRMYFAWKSGIGLNFNTF